MKTTCLCILMTVFSVMFLTGACSKEEPQYEGPHLSFELNVVDFGEMEQQEEQTREVGFRNTGNETLEIKKVKSSCGCTAATPTDKIIDPGETGILNVTFKSGKSQGEVEKVISVTTNDSLNPIARLPVKAYIKTDLKLEPRALDFGEVKLGEVKMAETRIMSQNGKDFEIVFVEADSTSFDYKLTPIEEDGNPGYLIEVSLKPTPKPQSFYKVINIRTDNARMPIHRLTVVANILGNVKIDPRAVLIRGEVGGPDQSKMVSITAVGDATVKLLSAETVKGTVKATTRTLEEGKSYEIDLTCPIGEPGRMKDYLLIKIDDEFEQEVRIPITVFTAKKKASDTRGSGDAK